MLARFWKDVATTWKVIATTWKVIATTGKVIATTGKVVATTGKVVATTWKVVGLFSRRFVRSFRWEAISCSTGLMNGFCDAKKVEIR